jgi:hypothetical protein
MGCGAGLVMVTYPFKSDCLPCFNQLGRLIGFFFLMDLKVKGSCPPSIVDLVEVEDKKREKEK